MLIFTRPFFNIEEQNYTYNKEIFDIVKKDLANRLNIEVGEIELHKMNYRKWRDGCFEMGGICTQQIVPGYHIFLDYNGKIYEYRTNLDGSCFSYVGVYSGLRGLGDSGNIEIE